MFGDADVPSILMVPLSKVSFMVWIKYYGDSYRALQTFLLSYGLYIVIYFLVWGGNLQVVYTALCGRIKLA